jgi:glutamate carboxypeptidase
MDFCPVAAEFLAQITPLVLSPKPATPATLEGIAMNDLLHHLRAHQETLLRHIQALVTIESPSDDKAAVDRAADLTLEMFAKAGGVITRREQARCGDHLQVTFPGASHRKPVLLLGHYDTVWPIGTLASMPCEERDGKLYGPGAFDMKAGVVMMLHAVTALQSVRGELPRTVEIHLVADEEVGSATSRSLTESIARDCAAVLVLEPSLGPKGALKTARKGVGEYSVKVTGVSSHAGVDFQKGHSAIVEIARQIERIRRFTDLRRGTTVNPGVVRGGTRTNVVAAEAELQVDVRVARMAAAAGIEKKFRSLKAFDRKCKLEVSGGINRPPLERTPAIAGLFKQARDLAAQIGFKLTEGATGGGSDGNFTAAMGIPTLDGLGAIGDGAHAQHEHVDVASLPWRTALVAGLIEHIE